MKLIFIIAVMLSLFLTSCSETLVITTIKTVDSKTVVLEDTQTQKLYIIKRKGTGIDSLQLNEEYNYIKQDFTLFNK